MMLTCRICHRATPQDDVAEPAGAGRCVCLRCHTRRSGERRRLGPALRRALSDALTARYSRHAALRAGTDRGPAPRTAHRHRRAGRPMRAMHAPWGRYPWATRHIVPVAMLPPLPPGAVRIWLVPLWLPWTAFSGPRVRRPSGRRWVRRTGL